MYMLKITLAFLKDDGIDKYAIFGSIFTLMINEGQLEELLYVCIVPIWFNIKFLVNIEV